MDLSIVVPAFNEAGRITLTLTRTVAFLLQRPWSAEVLVVDDGSADQTVERVRAFAADLADERRVHVHCRQNPGNRGKGYAVRHGVRASRGAVVGFTDADYKTEIQALDQVMAQMAAGADVVIGDRTLAATRIEVRRRRYRELGTLVFRGLVLGAMGLRGYPDTQCGFKFYRAAAARALFAAQQVDGFMFDVEVLLLAVRGGYRVVRVPVVWHDDPDSRFQPLRGSLRNLGELARIRWRLPRAGGAVGVPD